MTFTNYVVHNFSTSEFMREDGEWDSDPMKAETYDEKSDAESVAKKLRNCDDNPGIGVALVQCIVTPLWT